METSQMMLDDAVAHTRTGDVWLFRGRSAADTAIRVATNAPVNHVGMAVVLDDMPPLMWHAELGRSMQDMWTGKHQRGVQLHDLYEAVRTWHDKYDQRAYFRQLQADITPEMEDAVLATIARMDGTPFPSATGLAARWIKGRARSQSSLETIYCAELIASTYEAMGLLSHERPENWYDPGRFWSGDGLDLEKGSVLRREIRVTVPALPGAQDDTAEQGERRRRDAARAWWRENGVRVQNERLGERLRSVADPAWAVPDLPTPDGLPSAPHLPNLPSMPSMPSMPSVRRPGHLPRMPRRAPRSEPESS
ncbi:MAG: hypothetical protein WCA29_05505 [Jiangellales bacterium]